MTSRSHLAELVASTQWIDTHEHLLEESTRLLAPGPEHRFHPCDDWSYLFMHYAGDDLVSAGMAESDRSRLFGAELNATEKWDLFEPYWRRCRNTGYMRAVTETIRSLFNIEVRRETAEAISSAMSELRRPGYYRTVLNDVAGVESCQVNSLEATFCVTSDPDLMPQDLNIGHLCLPERQHFDEWQRMSGISIGSLNDMVRVIDWYFDAYGSRAVAAKLAWAYERSLSVDSPDRAAAERAWELWARGDDTPGGLTSLQDFLFDHALRRIEDAQLPLKIHTGYFVGNDRMELRRVRDNVVDLVPLFMKHPRIDFIVMHTAYPYGGEVIAAAKHFHNVHADLCWAWIIDPFSTEDFVRRFLATAPASKLLCFGGDYMVVENVVGHAALARRGLARALEHAVEDSTLTVREAEELVRPLMRDNALRLMKRAKADANV